MKQQYRKTVAERQKELDSLSKTLVNGVSEYLNSDKYLEILNNISKFYDYSINNTLLIFLQKPNATYIASFSDFKKKFNRAVRAGEKAIKIYMPVKYKVREEVERTNADGQTVIEEETVEKIGFKVGNVFDYSQTEQIEGKPVIELFPAKELKQNVDDYDIIFTAIENSIDIPVKFENVIGGAKGYYSDKDKAIVVNNGMSELQNIKTLLHEWGHRLLHSSDKPEDISFWVAEYPSNHSLGVFQENLQLETAVELYKSISDNNGSETKEIGVVLKGSDNAPQVECTIVRNNEIQIEEIENIKELRDSISVQKTIMDLTKFFTTNGVELRSLREVQAESVAYLCSKVFFEQLGIPLDTSEYSFPYIATWANEPELLLKSLSAVKTTANFMIGKVENEIENLLQIREPTITPTPASLAHSLTEFAKEYDPYGYQDNEEYLGCVYDQNYSAVSKNGKELVRIKEHLNEVIIENRDCKMGVCEIISVN